MHNSTKPQLFLAFSRVDALSPPLLAAISHDKRQKAETLASARRRAEYVCARGLLRHLLQEATGLPADSHVLSTTDTGKPICSGGPGVSISHAKGTVACAVALTGDVGIDIEFTHANRDTRRLAKQYFSTVENNWLDQQQEDSFYMLWVLKEAYLKILGSGLAGGLDRLQCRIEPPIIEAALGLAVTCRLSLFKWSEAYVGLATTDIQGDEISVLHWNPGIEQLIDTARLEKLAAGEARPNSSLY
jgi:phosphopantetheinyl transferase